MVTVVTVPNCLSVEPGAAPAGRRPECLSPPAAGSVAGLAPPLPGG